MRVYIVGIASAYGTMFVNAGWEVVDNIEGADLVQFTGGSDVSPTLYGEATHPRTHTHPARDEQEAKIFDKCIELGKPMAGICRGGQFLNVMSGGTMVQDVQGHAITGGHEVFECHTGDTYNVTSTHHQMMRPGDNAILVACADNIGKRKQHCDSNGDILAITDTVDVEVCYYPKTNCLCFQPHPEFFNAPTKCRDKYFEYIEEYLLK